MRVLAGSQSPDLLPRAALSAGIEAGAYCSPDLRSR
jgi:hypothetical protein